METAKSCRHCRSRCPYCSDAPHCFPSTTDEVVYINQDCTTIDEQIRLLQFQKANHKRRLNELQSNTRALPPETLSEIFQHVYHKINKKPLFQVSSVCSHWHKVVHSTPSLWSKLRLSLHQDKVEGQLKLLQLWLSNVGSVPLTLQLTMNRSNKSTADPILPILTAKINAEKIRVLKLYSASLSWTSLVVPNCRHLEQLELAYLCSVQGTTNPPVLNLENQLRLQTLTLHGTLHATIRISPSSNITTLMIREAQDIWSNLKFIGQFQTLTELDITFRQDAYPSQQDSADTDNACSAHHHLRILRINVFAGLYTFLGHLKLPALEIFQIGIVIPDRRSHFQHPSASQLCTILPKVPTIVTILCDTNHVDSKWSLFLCQLFSGAEQIRCLHVFMNDVSDDDKLVRHLLEFLSKKLPDGTYPLPDIRQLTFQGDGELWFGALLQMMINRRMGLQKHFYLEADLRNSWQVGMLNSSVTILTDQGCMVSMKTRITQ